MKTNENSIELNLFPRKEFEKIKNEVANLSNSLQENNNEINELKIEIQSLRESIERLSVLVAISIQECIERQ